MAVCGITVDADYEALPVSLLQNAMLIMFIVTVVETVGDTTGVAQVGLDR